MCFVLLILSRYRTILYLAQLYIVGLYTLRELRDVQLCNIIILIIIVYKQNLFLTGYGPSSCPLIDYVLLC